MGADKQNVLFFNPGDQNWWLGQFDSRNKLGFEFVGNTANFFTNPNAGQPTFLGDFSGIGQEQILFYNPGDNNWWLGQINDETNLGFTLIGNTANFFTSPNAGQPTFLGNFSGDCQQEILFYNPGDNNWWLGQVNDQNQLGFSKAGNTANFFTFPGSSSQPTFLGDFTGSGQDEILFYNPGDQNWWLGQFNAQNELGFSLAGNTANLFTSPGSSAQPTFLGDFSGSGQQEILFYNPGDNNWWLGQINSEAKLSFIKVGNTANFFTFPGSSEQPTFLGDFSGISRLEILFYNPGDNNWWLGQINDENQLGFGLAGNTANFFTSPGSGQPTFLGNFSGMGKDGLLFYNPGDQNWWLGQVYQDSHMVHLTNGYLSAPYIDEYNLQSSDATLVMMVKPDSTGTLISTGSFELVLNSNNELEFTFFRSNSGQSQSIVSPATAIVNSGQCHIIACFAPKSGSLTMYLDGNELTCTSQTTGSSPTANQSIFIGNNSSSTSQYTGGLMNIGIWNRILSQRESNLAGYGRLDATGVGPVAYWGLNNSLTDGSIFSNSLVGTPAQFHFMACLECVSLYGPNSYSFCQIEGLYQPGTVNIMTYTQTLRVGSDAAALFAAISDNSGYAKYPQGVFVEVTDPTGAVLNADQNTTSISVKTKSVPGYTTNSLNSIMANDPKEGIWTVTITAPSNVYFRFQMQAIPSKDIMSSYYETVQGFHNTRRHAEVQSWSLASFVVGGIINLAATVAIVATDGAALPLAASAIALGTGMMFPTLIDKHESVSDVESKISISPSTSAQKSLHDVIVADLNSSHADLKGKVWDSSQGTLPANWILECGTVDEQNNTQTTFNQLVTEAETCIDMLMFGDLSGAFLDDLKAFINSTSKTLTIRIFTGTAFNQGTYSSYQVDPATNTFLSLGLSPGKFVEEASAIFEKLVNDINSIPDNISLYVGAGAVPWEFYSAFTVPAGWGHHKIMIVDGKKAIAGGMNFWQDSMAAPANDAVNDLSALVEGGAVGSVQNFTNNFWNELIETSLSGSSDYSFYIQHANVSGGYYYPVRLAKGNHCFAIVGSKAYSSIDSLVQSLNSNIFKINTTPTSGDSQIISVGRRNGYYFSDREPSDIAILDMVKNARTSVYLSQQAICYPTQSTKYVWEDLFTQLRLALQRGVAVHILVSRDPSQEGTDYTGGYSSDYATRVRNRLLTGISDPSSVSLEIFNYPMRNHAKVVIVDGEAFYIGSHNVYPTKFPVDPTQKAGEVLATLGIYANPVATMATLIAIECLSRILPTSYATDGYEVGLGEFGFLVCDSSKCTDFITNYWTPKWTNAKNS